MRHRIGIRKLGRTSAHRLALLRNLSTALFERERITTTLVKAKQLRPFAERLVTLAKRETLHARRRVLRHIRDRTVVAKLFDSISARYAQRPGGYTRIIRLGPRRGDHAEMAVIELVDSEGAAEAAAEPAPAKGKGKRRRAKAEAEEPAKPAPKRRKKTAAKAPAKRKAGAKKAAGSKTEKAAAAKKKKKKAKSSKKTGTAKKKKTKGKRKA